MDSKSQQSSKLPCILETDESTEDEYEDSNSDNDNGQRDRTGISKPIITTSKSTWNFLAKHLGIDMHRIMCHGVASVFRMDERLIDMNKTLRQWECLTQEIIKGFGLEFINCVNDVVCHFSQNFQTNGFDFAKLPGLHSRNFLNCPTKKIVWIVDNKMSVTEPRLLNLFIEQFLKAPIGTKAPLVVPLHDLDDMALTSVLELLLQVDENSSKVRDYTVYNLFLQIGFGLIFASKKCDLIIVDTNIDLFDVSNIISLAQKLNHETLFLTTHKEVPNDAMIRYFLRKHKLITWNNSPDAIRNGLEMENQYLEDLSRYLQTEKQTDSSSINSKGSFETLYRGMGKLLESIGNVIWSRNSISPTPIDQKLDQP